MFSPRLFCRYRQVGENASAVLLSVLSTVGLTIKEKLGGERECGTESESRSENGRSLNPNGRERGGQHMFCAAPSLQPVSIPGPDTKVTQPQQRRNTILGNTES